MRRNTVMTFIISMILLNSFNPKGMLPLDILIVALVTVIWVIYRPKKPKPKPVTIEDVRATITSAYKTLEDGYAVIYEKEPR